MYDELVARLWECASGECFNCSQYTETTNASVCSKELMKQAADAIEFLQTYKVAFENIISMGGWWLVGQDKNLYRMNVPMSWPPKGTKTVEVFPLPEPPKEE